MKEYLLIYLGILLGILLLMGLLSALKSKKSVKGSVGDVFGDETEYRHRIDPKMDIRSFSGGTSSKAETKDSGKSKDGDSVDPKK